MPTARSSTGSALARRLRARLIGLHVLDIVSIEGSFLHDVSGSLGFEPYLDFSSKMREALQERGQVLLDAFRDAAASRPAWRATRRSRWASSPTRSAIRRAPPTWSIVGHRGVNEQFSTGLLGGTTESVTRKSPKPVLVTPLEFKEIGRPLLAYDGSQRASAALHAAAEVASALGLPLTVVHVAKDNGADGDRVLDEAQRYLQSYELPVTITVRSPGPPTSASSTCYATAATTCSSSARTATRGSSRWCSAARPSTCCATAPRRCSWRADSDDAAPLRPAPAVGSSSEPGRKRAIRASSMRARPLDAPISRWSAGLRGDALDLAAHDLVDVALDLGQTIGDRGEVLDALLHALVDARARRLGSRADGLDAAVDGGGQALERRLAVLDQLAQHAQREQPALLALLFEDDLRERDGGEILAGLVLEDLHLLAGSSPTARSRRESRSGSRWCRTAYDCCTA